MSRAFDMNVRQWTNQRLMDLVRHQRHDLLDAGLITEGEFAFLVNEGSTAARRLEDYDRVRAESDALRAEVARLNAEIARLVADAGQRRETGPVQFGDDWPGVFIRGDEAFGLAIATRCLVDSVLRGDPPSPLDVNAVSGLGRTLEKCNVGAATDKEGDRA